MESTFFHIDVNSAYLSWTALQRLSEGDDTDLRTIPSIIGGDTEKRHGVVLAKSIPAKKYGIRTGEPVVNAFRKCPSLVMAAPDHNLYHRKSHALMEYLAGICPDIEQVSVDECYMNYTSVATHYDSPLACAQKICTEVLHKFGFTVNIGISNRKVLAKMASDFEKPNRIHTLYSHEIRQKMWPLPISDLYMCGQSSVEALRKLEILTIGDLARSQSHIIEAHLKSHGRLLWEYANGIDKSVIISEPAKAKGIGNSTTLSQDVLTGDEAKKVLLSLAESVGTRLRADKWRATMISVEIKYADFQSVSHQTTLPAPTDADNLIYETACRLFDETWNLAPIRLLGIRTAKLSPSDEPVQLSIFDLEVSEKQRKLDAALDSIRGRYGKGSVIRGSLMDTKSQPAEYIKKPKE